MGLWRTSFLAPRQAWWRCAVGGLQAGGKRPTFSWQLPSPRSQSGPELSRGGPTYGEVVRYPILDKEFEEAMTPN